MKVVNVTDSVLVIAGQRTHYATLHPGETAALLDEMRDDDTISSMLDRGMLQELKAGQKSPRSAKTDAKKPQKAVSGIKTAEVPVGKAAVSGVTGTENKEDAEIPGVGDDGEGGTQLIKRGGKTRPAGVRLVSPSSIKSKEPIIKHTSKAKSAAMGAGASSGMIVNRSGVPGQARLVDPARASDEELEDVHTHTQEKMKQVERDKKVLMLVNNYQTWDVEKRLGFLANVKDKQLCQAMLKLERSPAIQLKIKARMKKL
jgi:hypothetical protein